MEHYPKVTIVTPSFNQAQFLEQTIQSVLAQDYPNIEYIVMDGGSTDGSVEIIRKHEDRIAYWLSERDNGQASAINRGFAHAEGSIYAWVNSDDLLAPSAVRIAVDYLSRNPKVGVVYGDRLHIDARGNVVGVNRMPAYYPAMLKRNITLPQETVFFRRDVFEKVGGVDESLQFSLDFDLWVHMSRATTIRHIPAFLGCFREHSTSKSVSAEKYAAEHRDVFRRHFNRPVPGSLRMAFNRLRHKLRLARERRGGAYQTESREIRELADQAAAVGVIA